MVWRGNPEHHNDKKRSCLLKDFSLLFDLPEFAFFSLQKQRSAIDVYPNNMIDLSGHLETFADTAALIAHLDLVISVDTSVAHLAGAMGKKVWTLLPYVPDWRWGIESESTPWYPTMQLFRQQKDKKWLTVLYRVKTELKSVNV